MSLTLKNRVFETTATTGTGAYLLAGVVNASCRPFADAGNGGKIPYLVEQGTESEWGIGTYDSGANTLARTTVLGNYLGTTAAINWSAGTKNIYSPDLVELFTWLTFSDTFGVSALKVAESAAPSTPASGFISIYAKTDGILYQKDDAGVESALSSAGMQPIDATLTALAGLTIAANSLTIGSGADAFSQTTFAANTFPARSSSGNLVAKTITDAALTVLDDTTVGAMLDTLGGATHTGTGGVVCASSPTLVTPALGTPSAIVLTNATGTAASLTAGAATILATARTINGVSFNGSANITVTAAGSTLSDTVTVEKGGTGLTALGTALQVLRTNAGATAMEWASPAGDVATDAIWDAKGDLAGGTGANMAARLAVGTDGQVLTAASGEATGLIWADTTGGGSDPDSVFLVHKNGTAQDFTNATSTKLTWSTEEFDAGSEFADNAFTVDVTGKYLLQCAARVTATGTGTTSIKLHLYKNGTLYKTFMNFIALAGLTDITLEGSVVGEATAADYFEVFIEFAGLSAGTATVGGAAADTWFSGVRLALAGATGATGATGAAGADGADGEDGVGVPIGGTTGQVLAKNSNTNFDTEWIDQSAGDNLLLPTTTDTVGQIKWNSIVGIHTYGTGNFFAGIGAGNFTVTGTGKNVGVGKDSLPGMTTAYENVCVGHSTGFNSTSAYRNTSIGCEAGVSLTTGNDCVFLGYNSDAASDALVNAIGIGANTSVSTSNTMSLGDANIRVIIGDSAAIDCAKLAVNSNGGGFLPPRMTTTQRDAIGSPVDGLVIYNTTTDLLECYQNGAWAEVGGGGDVTLAGTQTLTNKRVTKRVSTTATASTLTPEADSYDIVNVTALAGNMTIAVPSGTPTDGQVLVIRIRDNGTSRTLTWDAEFAACGPALPGVTATSKWLVCLFLYSIDAGAWHLLAANQEA